MTKQKMEFSLFLHDIRSVQNVASIYRLADCIGCKKIVLSGITPGSVDRFGRVREDFIKISLGSEKTVLTHRIGKELQSPEYKKETDKSNLQEALKFINSWKDYEDISVGLDTPYKSIKKRFVVGLEQDRRSVDYKTLQSSIKDWLVENGDVTTDFAECEFLVVPGREVEGLGGPILELCDFVCEIPQYGKKESLNIFSSCAVVLYRWFDLL